MFFWSLRVALADLSNNPLRLFLEVFSMGALLALVLTLAALGEGIVQGFATQSLDTPEGRRIFLTPRAPFTAQDIKWLREQSETGFVEPNAMEINSTRVLESHANESTKQANVRMLPSGPGDPYLADNQLPPNAGHVLVGEDLRQFMALKIGDVVYLNLPQSGYSEATLVSLEVTGFVDLGGWVARGILVWPALSLAIDSRSFDPKIDFNSPQTGYGTSARTEFASMRLYANSVSDVLPLVEKVNSRGLLAQPREQLIAEREALERVVEIVFQTILLLTGVAFVITFFVSMGARLLHLEGSMTVLRIQGFPLWAIWCVVIGQSLIVMSATALSGFCMAFLMVRSLNTRLPALLETLSITGMPAIIETQAVALALVLTLILALVAAAFGALLITRNKELQVRWDAS